MTVTPRPLRAVQLVAGEQHTCARISNGTVWCWGNNAAGQLGDGSPLDHASARPVLAGANPVVELAAGGQWTFARLFNQTAYTVLYWWGLGNSEPSVLYAPPGIVQLAAGGSSSGFCTGHHVCALLSDGTVQCLDGNAHGELGNGTTTGSETFVPVQALANVARVTAGGCHTCALLRDGTASCWGLNDNGQIGDGTITNRLIPTPIRFTRRVLQISAGYASTCAVLAGQAARSTDRESVLACWGANGASRTIGLPSGSAWGAVPTFFPGLVGVSAVALGRNFGCAQLAAGGLRCWGNNDGGQLAIGQATSGIGLIGQQVESVGEVSLGDAHGCGLRADGSVRCWGTNQYGQLGDGSGTSAARPVEISTPETWSTPPRR